MQPNAWFDKPTAKLWAMEVFLPYRARQHQKIPAAGASAQLGFAAQCLATLERMDVSPESKYLKMRLLQIVDGPVDVADGDDAATPAGALLISIRAVVLLPPKP
jgi:hypothetical protein